MILRQDSYVHELSVDTILRLLETPWQTEEQTVTSAITNDNNLQEPNIQWITMGENTAGINAFFDIQFEPTVKRILDVGGGRFDHNSVYLKRERDIELLVWDPYNRSGIHNSKVRTAVEQKKVDAATSMSVLNVIPEVAVRLAHITTLKASLFTGGKAYFKIWPGEEPLKGTYLPCATDTYYQSNAYADRFLKEIEIVFGIGNVKLDKHVPNLIVAFKQQESHPTRSEILRIQIKSERQSHFLSRQREKSVSYLYSRNNIFKAFSSNLSLLKKIEDDFIKQHRHLNPAIQHEYDKKYGLVLGT